MQRCPNCGANNPNDVAECLICGTLLSSRKAVPTPKSPPEGKAAKIKPASSFYSPDEGEDDLMVRGILNTPMATIIGLLLCLLATGGAIVAGVMFIPDDEQDQKPQAQALVSGTAYTGTPENSPTPAPTAFPTNTRPAPPLLPTITVTASETPEPTPCTKVAGAGDTLYGLAQECGHRHFSIVQMILTLNPQIECENCLAQGDTVIIPWPTSTPDPNGDTGAVVPSGGGNADTTVMVVADNSGAPANEFGTPDSLATLFVEPTLRPGLAWHIIAQDETLYTIISIYNADAKVIADLNPEIEFRQCDYGEKFGGPNCSVFFSIGQRIRVPVPPPTATLSPTPSGSETPTPTITPTFNAPQPYQPIEGTAFDGDSLVTLRWSATGTLDINENYLITVTNLDTKDIFRARTRDQFLILPEDWKPHGSKAQKFEWIIEIAVLDGDQILSTRQPTEPRHFSWGG
ncbi:MAG: hypothetical protein HY862_16650 [Chloroflexi bacterium]|nr:hypothetical protein [Chloroflexota bacterium]